MEYKYEKASFLRLYLLTSKFFYHPKLSVDLLYQTRTYILYPLNIIFFQ